MKTRNKCYYADDRCQGTLWHCVGCGEAFCSEGHPHVTELGRNKECVACERERKDAKLLTGEDATERLLARTNVLDKLDSVDK